MNPQAALAAQDAQIALAAVHPGWRPYINEGHLQAAFAGAAKNGPYVPAAGRTLLALSYFGPGNARAVVLGQDPYHGDKLADGLCFSVKSGTLPPSLQAVYACLRRAGLRAESKTPCGDLSPLACQRVLLLNRGLTTKVGKAKAHLKHWEPVVDGLITALLRRPPGAAPLYFLLWGREAQSYAPEVRRAGHVALEWSHPSPLADNRLPAEARFVHCDHFEAVNAALPGLITWDTQRPCMAFSDGSCQNNGKPNARAGYAAVVLGGHFGRTVLRGEVRPVNYALGLDAAGRPVLRTGHTPVPPSNNRAELLGLIHCMLLLLHGCARGPVELRSDSKISVQTLLEWLPKRLQKGTEAELKNLDLVMVAWGLLEQLRACAESVDLQHVRAHQPHPGPLASTRARLEHAGNKLADEQAAAGFTAGEAPDYAVVLTSPLSLPGLEPPAAGFAAAGFAECAEGPTFAEAVEPPAFAVAAEQAEGAAISVFAVVAAPVFDVDAALDDIFGD